MTAHWSDAIRSPFLAPLPETNMLKMESMSPEFGKIPPQQISLDDNPNHGRVYFIHKGRIVAVAIKKEPRR